MKIGTSSSIVSMKSFDYLRSFSSSQGFTDGEWYGEGLKGLQSSKVVEGARVTQGQVNLLFGLGVHPEADEILNTGRRCSKYWRGKNVSQGEIEAAAAGNLSYTSLAANRRFLRLDLVLSAPQDVSLFWAIANAEMANAIEACHRQAVKETITWMENNATYAQMKERYVVPRHGRGVIAAVFNRFSDDELRPNLHSHLVISSSIQTIDGFWKKIDFGAFNRYRKAIEEYYLTVLQYLLIANARIDFVQEIGGFGDKSWRVAGFNTAPVKRTLRLVYGVDGPKKLFKNFFSEHKQSEFVPNLPNLRQLWAVSIAKDPDLLKAPRLGHWEKHNGGDGKESGLFEQISEEARAELIDKYSFFSRHEIDEEVSKALRGYPFLNCEEIFATHKQVVDNLILTFVRLDRSDAELPAALRDGDNGLDRTRDDIVLTAKEILGEEKFSIDACGEYVPYKASKITIWKHIVEYRLKGIKRNRLNPGQRRLISHFVSSKKRVSTGVGPAGAGKTSAMRLVSEIWKNEGHKVVGLAPSAAAAEVLSKELGIGALTIDKFVYGWSPESVNTAPSGILPGDMLLVDEAGMAHTHNIYKLISIARSADAMVCFIGDPYQLDPVGLSGLFGAMTRDETSASAQLDEVVRFEDPEEQKASMFLRCGSEACLDFYLTNKRIKIVSDDELFETVIKAFFADEDAGYHSLIIAPTNREVDKLNQLIRDYYVSTGKVQQDPTVVLSHGEEASPGDYVVARKNEKFDLETHGTDGRVYNGERFRIEKIEPDKSLNVTPADPASTITRLPYSYVADSVHLGYASTVYRAQGVTVDIVHAIINRNMSLPSLYVALTRGRKGNSAYIAEDGYPSPKSAGSPTTKAREIMKGILKKDPYQFSAMEKQKKLREEHDSDLSAERKRRLSAYGYRLLRQSFLDEELPSYVDSLHTSHRDYTSMRKIWENYLKKGIDPRDIPPEKIFSLNGVDTSLLMKLLGRYPSAEGNNLPPQTETTDKELFEWLKNANSFY